MIIFKCKMCGGDLEIDEQMAIGTCSHCGSTMTLPKAADERITNLFNRANFYRRSSEFDKAIKVYENILSEDNTSAEAHWGLVLCKYGIEYVEDPATGQRIPTCHRAQKTSIFLDVDYQQAIEYADETARALYKAEAATIDAIQKQILAISEQEAPYDIFICYKETSETGSRTKDSVLAQDIYFSLNEQGYKVFFSKITLEDKLGSAYEPYIFAALNSSKVMIVVATSAEHVSAVWTKNEWSRYLTLINKGEKKVLIPVYRDMDPYELPEEFSHLQALDMIKLGFIQDLTRGVKKILDEGRKADKPTTETSKNNNASGGAQPLIMRAFLCLEDGDFTKADDLLEQALNLEPMSANAYIGKLMVELQLKDETALAAQTEPISGHNNYQKAQRFAEGDYKAAVEGYNQAILDRLEEKRVAAEAERQATGLKRVEALYNETVEKADLYENTKKQTEGQYKGYAEKFRSISGYKDADKLAKTCDRLAEKSAKDERIEQARLAELKRIKEEKQKALTKRIAIIGTPALVAAILFYLLIANYLIPLSNYNKAVALMESEQFEEAGNILLGLGDFKDSNFILKQCKYEYALLQLDLGNYDIAVSYLSDLGDYDNAQELLLYSREKLFIYQSGADYYIDYENGTIPIGDLPIGARVVDPSWEWEFRTGDDYAREAVDETRPVTWIVVAMDHYSGMEPHVTLLSAELIGRYVFDNSTNRGSQYGSNHWGDSGTTNASRGLRPWLNSTDIHSGEGFYRAFSENFKRAVLATTLPNKEWKNGSSYSTQDYVFIPSTTELGDSAHRRTYQIGTAYAYFGGAGDAKRVARLDGKTLWYLTRSPSSNRGSNVRFVDGAGEFSSNYAALAYDVYYAVRPALNLKSGILVSEIK